ncbi:serine/threonine-protein kinase [Nonomuraea jiangxiensis]|uniref:non-specific serine/threonine protein kinase n=1 Tax=Nonomuraea jiangxiensis TaxID=633440 RepID=A0A1G8A304_9ACTN|nr:serine/threonine-protein kinase [Nonomuraea jiangxiensis]SDH15298.1 Serine/threonine protein kinase [Nonomuraea jiangxiensis]
MSVPRYEGWLLAGRYRLQAELGQGGMGRVWRGHDELLDRPVAVKEVTLQHRPPSEREALLGRTMTEARLAARLSHPHIATVYDVVEADERPWIVLQLVSAPTLADVLAERGPLSPTAVAALGLQLLDALKAAHAAGIVHRDVKPANILLDAGERHAVLTDFGLATSLEQPLGLTQEGIVVGTPAYIAPERARGGPPTPQTDLWSLGVLLYAAVEGRSPFEQGSALATISAVLTADPAPFQRAGPLAPLIAGLLDKDPACRTGIAAARRQLRWVSLPSRDDMPQTGDLAVSTAARAIHRLSSTWVPAARRGAIAGADAAPPKRTRHLSPRFSLDRARRANVRHAAVVAALVLGVLAATFWPGVSPGPPAAEPRPGGHDPAAPATSTAPTTSTRPTTSAAPSATPALEPATTAAPSPAAKRESRRVTVQRRTARPEPIGTPAPPPAGAPAPFGQAKKAIGRIPPGHGDAHPGRGKANGKNPK